MRLTQQAAGAAANAGPQPLEESLQTWDKHIGLAQVEHWASHQWSGSRVGCTERRTTTIFPVMTLLCSPPQQSQAAATPSKSPSHLACTVLSSPWGAILLLLMAQALQPAAKVTAWRVSIGITHHRPQAGSTWRARRGGGGLRTQLGRQQLRE